MKECPRRPDRVDSLVARHIRTPQGSIEEFCRRHHIRQFAFFGSIIRDDFGPASDVDVLVEYEPDHVPGLAFFTEQEELGTILGRRVDLNTKGWLRRHIRDQVLAEAEVVYAQT